MGETIEIETGAREELVDITRPVAAAVAHTGVRDGIALVFSTHTTAGITINENADPDVARDMLHWLRKLVPPSPEFRHGEGNSDAHLKTSFVGISQTVPVRSGALALGRWQAIFLAEFDGPRRRRVVVEVVAAS